MEKKNLDLCEVEYLVGRVSIGAHPCEATCVRVCVCVYGCVSSEQNGNMRKKGMREMM